MSYHFDSLNSKPALNVGKELQSSSTKRKAAPQKGQTEKKAKAVGTETLKNNSQTSAEQSTPIFLKAGSTQINAEKNDIYEISESDPECTSAQLTAKKTSIAAKQWSKGRWTKKEIADWKAAIFAQPLEKISWIDVSKKVGTRSHEQCKDRWHYKKNSNIDKTSPSQDEIDEINALMKEYKTVNNVYLWGPIAIALNQKHPMRLRTSEQIKGFANSYIFNSKFFEKQSKSVELFDSYIGTPNQEQCQQYFVQFGTQELPISSSSSFTTSSQLERETDISHHSAELELRDHDENSERDSTFFSRNYPQTFNQIQFPKMATTNSPFSTSSSFLSMRTPFIHPQERRPKSIYDQESDVFSSENSSSSTKEKKTIKTTEAPKQWAEGPWTQQELSNLRIAVQSQGSDKPISWKAVSKMVGTRSPSQCRDKWANGDDADINTGLQINEIIGDQDRSFEDHSELFNSNHSSSFNQIFSPKTSSALANLISGLSFSFNPTLPMPHKVSREKPFNAEVVDLSQDYELKSTNPPGRKFPADLRQNLSSERPAELNGKHKITQAPPKEWSKKEIEELHQTQSMGPVSWKAIAKVVGRSDTECQMKWHEIMEHKASKPLHSKIDKTTDSIRSHSSQSGTYPTPIEKDVRIIEATEKSHADEDRNSEDYYYLTKTCFPAVFKRNFIPETKHHVTSKNSSENFEDLDLMSLRGNNEEERELPLGSFENHLTPLSKPMGSHQLEDNWNFHNPYKY